MAKITISVPDNLHAEVKAARKKWGLNVSKVCQRALKKAVSTEKYMITTA